MGNRSRRSREALGNIAHALKTRLAVLNQMAEQPELAAHPHVRAAIREATDGAHRIVERELKRARLTDDAMPGQRIALRDELALLSRTLKVLYADTAPRIAWEVAPGHILPASAKTCWSCSATSWTMPASGAAAPCCSRPPAARASPSRWKTMVRAVLTKNSRR